MSECKWSSIDEKNVRCDRCGRETTVVAATGNPPRVTCRIKAPHEGVESSPPAAKITKPKRFADLPACPNRSDSRSVKDECSTCNSRYVQVADCSVLGTLCSVLGTPLNNAPTAKCLGCLYNSTVGSNAKG